VDMNIFKSLLWELHKTNEVHLIVLKSKCGLIFFNNATSMVTQYFMIIVEGSKWVHVGMGREGDIAKWRFVV